MMIKYKLDSAFGGAASTDAVGMPKNNSSLTPLIPPLIPLILNYTRTALANTFAYLAAHYATDAAGNFIKDAAGNKITLADWWGRPNGTLKNTGFDVPPETQKLIANTVYSSEANQWAIDTAHAPPNLGNGTIASGDGWGFRGHGLIQITGRGNTEAFANYVGGVAGATIKANPDSLASDKNLAARSAAWYWTHRASGVPKQNLNPIADQLDMTLSATELGKFNAISSGIGTKDHAARWTNYTNNVNAILMGANPYESIQSVLKQLGVTATNKTGYESQFGISLHKFTPQDIGSHLLLADSNPVPVTQAAMQNLLTQAQADLNLPEGEFAMFVPDMPALPPQSSSIVMIAQANQAKHSLTKPERVMGVCHVVANIPQEFDNNGLPQNGTSPWSEASAYFRLFEHRNINITYGSAGYIDKSTSTVVQQTKHGMLIEEKNLIYPNLGSNYFYKPDEGYFGDDFAVIQAEVNGYKVKINYYFHSLDTKAYIDSKVCEPNGFYWKISTLPTPIDPATQQGNPALATILANASLSFTGFADLAGGALGQTTGSTITLDTNAAGNNWYIDATPGDNAEYLPTSNPFEWVAKAGSAAAGKMDMLSVLLHEYGHALGIDHNADAHDYMGTTLTAGVRRLPTADEMALMQQLIAQAKDAVVGASPARESLTHRGYDPLLQGSTLPNDAPNPFPTLPLGGMSLAFAGLLQRNRYGGLNAVLNNSTLTQYAVAANATLTNGSLNNANGWATQGSVNIGNGIATLNEVSTSQTRLSQVFMVNANDRYLSFTLSGTALDNPSTTLRTGLTGAPDDAFEVALLNANTGVSLLGSNGLTHSDAFLNLQADGTEYLSQGITRINNPDGSRTYRLDLSGVVSGTAVNLSFDLIGFGANPVLSGVEGGSHVNISDVRLSGLPQLHDDAVTILEDGTLSFNPYAQVITGNFTSTVVDAPAHGAVTMNADGSVNSTPASAGSGLPTFGTFSYTPALNYNGTDSFTYRLNDGALQSNLATDVGRVSPADATQQIAGETRPTLDGWNTQGSVTFTPSAFVTSDPASISSGRTVASFATLNEISTSTYLSSHRTQCLFRHMSVGYGSLHGRTYRRQAVKMLINQTPKIA